VSAPIWIGLQSAVVGAFETIVAVKGGSAIMVGEAVVCAAARFSRRRRFFVAFLDAVSVVVSAGCTGTVCAGCGAAVFFLASRAITAALNASSVSSISGGNGIPSSLGQSRWSRRLFSSICSRVRVSGSHQLGTGKAAAVTVTGAVGAGSTVALRRSRARSFLAAFFQILSIVAKNGSCCCSTFANGD
jgi:hypothetical protein